MTEILQSASNNNTAELFDSLEFEREEFIDNNAPNKSFFELDKERNDENERIHSENRARALAEYAKRNLSFNGYTENID